MGRLQAGAYLEVKYLIMVPSEGEPTIYNHNLEDPDKPDNTSVCMSPRSHLRGTLLWLSCVQCFCVPPHSP